MNEAKLKKLISGFVLVGMTISILIITAIKMGNTEGAKGLLLLSVFGSFMGLFSVVTSANGKILTFIFGLFDVSIYGVMCIINWAGGSSGLGNGLLHLLYFIPMEIIGFYQWRKLGAEGTKSVKARRLNPKQWMVTLAAAFALSIATYFILSIFDRSKAEDFIKLAVVLDVIPLVCNIVGQYLMSTAYMDQWFFWIMVNVSSIMMWANSYLTSGDSYALIYFIKYIFYLINAVFGLWVWMRLSRPTDGEVLTSKE